MNAVLEYPSLGSETEPDLQIVGSLTLRFPKSSWSDDEFLAICQANETLKIEQDEDGNLIVMAPSDTETGFNNARIIIRLGIWSLNAENGYVGESSTMFKLPNGAKRAPDAAWIAKDRWDALPEDRRKPFAEICPDFVIELMSPSDRLPTARRKMEEWIGNGVRLGWLLNPKKRQVEIYEPGKVIVILDDPKTVSGEPTLPGFVFDLAEIWK